MERRIPARTSEKTNRESYLRGCGEVHRLGCKKAENDKTGDVNTYSICGGKKTKAKKTSRSGG